MNSMKILPFKIYPLYSVLSCTYIHMQFSLELVNSLLYHTSQITTDTANTCINSFFGTSAATPLAAGIIALVLEAKLVKFISCVVLGIEERFTKCSFFYNLLPLQ